MDALFVRKEGRDRCECCVFFIEEVLLFFAFGFVLRCSSFSFFLQAFSVVFKCFSKWLLGADAVVLSFLPACTQKLFLLFYYY